MKFIGELPHLTKHADVTSRLVQSSMKAGPWEVVSSLETVELVYADHKVALAVSDAKRTKLAADQDAATASVCS